MINDSVLTNTIIVVTTLWELYRTMITIISRFFVHKKNFGSYAIKMAFVFT